ncbi:hypothetical protein [Paenibacillus sp. R14(2021)]|uniref:hypothetical protein n=1 Tax=Paenibacillus sp. R14(2021) TaxID=2859228 RepID=UPI001C6116E8|nr:hypothetical protein [Paenibacillus sp. R14(2021)]
METIPISPNPDIIHRFNGLLVQQRSDKQLAVSVLGQDILIGSFDDRQLYQMNQYVKYPFERSFDVY